MRPALAPTSIAMFEIVMRASTESASMTGPQNSMALYVAPSAPIRPARYSTRSLLNTPGCSAPV
jgi:hypothetical protein